MPLLTAVDTCARVAADGGWLGGLVDARSRLIRAAVHADPRKPATNDIFESDVTFLQQFARLRPAVVVAEVEALRRGQ